MLVIYLASIVGAYLTIRKIFSEGGEWENLTPGFAEVGFIFLPGANTFISLAGLVVVIMEWIDSLNIKINYNRFFRIDKEEEIDEEEELRKETEAYNKWKSAHDRRRKELQKN